MYSVSKFLSIMKPRTLKHNVQIIVDCVIRFDLLYSNALGEPSGLFRPNQYLQSGLGYTGHIVDHTASPGSLLTEKTCVRSGLTYHLFLLCKSMVCTKQKSAKL